MEAERWTWEKLKAAADAEPALAADVVAAFQDRGRWPDPTRVADKVLAKLKEFPVRSRRQPEG